MNICLCDWVWHLWNLNFIQATRISLITSASSYTSRSHTGRRGFNTTVDVQTPTNKTDASIKMSLDQGGFCLLTINTIEMTHLTTFFKKFILALHKNHLNLVFSKFKERGDQNVWIKMSLYHKSQWTPMSTHSIFQDPIMTGH